MMIVMDSELLIGIVGVLGTISSVVLLFVGRYLATKNSSEFYQQALARVIMACRTAVAMVQQTYVDAIKARSGGGLTDKEKAEAMSLALAAAKSLLGIKGLKIVASAFGLGGEQLELPFLTSHIEAAVAEQPKVIAATLVDPSPGSPQA